MAESASESRTCGARSHERRIAPPNCPGCLPVRPAGGFAGLPDSEWSHRDRIPPPVPASWSSWGRPTRRAGARPRCPATHRVINRGVGGEETGDMLTTLCDGRRRSETRRRADLGPRQQHHARRARQDRGGQDCGPLRLRRNVAAGARCRHRSDHRDRSAVDGVGGNSRNDLWLDRQLARQDELRRKGQRTRRGRQRVPARTWRDAKACSCWTSERRLPTTDGTRKAGVRRRGWQPHHEGRL